jgi:hypothetical protein
MNEKELKITYIRICQDCGAKQQSSPPPISGEPSLAFLNKKCKICKSTSLDRGKISDPSLNSDWD